MSLDLTPTKLQRILDFFSVGTLENWRQIESLDLQVRDMEVSYIDPISKKHLILPRTLSVDLCLLWTTHGGYLMVSLPPSEERRALMDIDKPFQFLKRKLGLLHVVNVSNFENDQFVTCHMFDMYHYLFAL